MIGLLRGFAAYEFVEVAALSACGCVLNDQRETAFVELVEPLVPANLGQRLFAGIAGKIDAQHADIAASACALHTRRPAAALLRPAANLFMVGDDSIGC